MEVKAQIVSYCNYQERCHKEVRNKLYELKCTTPQVEQYITELIQADLLNEERYARSYARGKFRMKSWGKQKIISQLKFNRISDYCIKKGLSEIDYDEYRQTALKLAERKWVENRSVKNLLARKSKVYNYLLQKGYEQEVIKEAIEIVVNGINDK